MPKIYLSPAYHKWNPCAVAGCDETTHNNLYVDELEVFLKACGFEIKRGPRRVPKSNEDGEVITRQVVKESNAWGADIHYISHTNAASKDNPGSARGYRPIIWKGNNPEGERFAEIMIKCRKEIYNQPVTLNKRSDLRELNTANAVAYYEEHVFHDNYADAKWFHDNLRAIARQTCKAFCEYFGVPFVDPYAVKETNKLYRVQVGAFSKKENAEKMQKKLKEIGIDAIIV